MSTSNGGGGGRPEPLRIVLAVVVIIVMDIAVVGIAQGRNEFQEQPAPSAAQVAQSRAQISAAGPSAQRGIEVFEEDGCNRCHALGAIGANGQLGPRMDSVPDEAEEDAEYIARSKRDSDNVMPRDYGTRLSKQELADVSELIHAAYIKGTGE